MHARLFALICCLLASVAPGQDTWKPEHLKKARELHAKYVVLDTHSDVTPKFENPDWDFMARHENGHMDVPRMREGGMSAEFMSIYMGRTPGEGRAIRKALIRIDSVHEVVRKHKGVLELATTAADVRRIKRAGKIACLMGIEGGHIIEDSLAALRMFHALGCRYMTLTHSFPTNWADSAGINEAAESKFGGLTEFGEQVVREMNRLGMMVDISHVADSTFEDALRVTTAPVIASHSSARAVCGHRRNLSDAMLLAVKKNGGVVQVNFATFFIDPDLAAATKAWDARHKAELDALAKKFRANRRAYWQARRLLLQKDPLPRTPLVVLARHVEHVAQVAGWDHVGIGADWDGVPALPAQMDHCGMLPNLTALLLARGATEEQLRGYLGANLLRVMEACEKRAAELAR